MLALQFCYLMVFQCTIKDDLLFEFISEEKATLFGISAKYIDALNNKKIVPKKNYNFSKLKTICSTGSPLSKDGFRLYL